jgi:DNA-binding beta-propeller fold protein YncE
VRSIIHWAFAFTSCLTWAHGAHANEYNFVTTEKPTVLLSINDGEVPALFAAYNPTLNPAEVVPDSITVIRLFKDKPPTTNTAYGTTSNSIVGSPHSAIVGRYGIITNHDSRRTGPGAPREAIGTNQIVAVDLESADLSVVSRLELTSQPRLALAHPDGQRVIVALSDHWGVMKIGEGGELVKVARSESPGLVYSFDISSDGRTIVAAMASGPDALAAGGIFHFVMNDDSSIELVREITSEKYAIDGPFSPRISPDGKRALVLNSLGLSDGKLDDVLVLDLTGDVRISQRISQVADGLESLAIHPSGEFAVVSCLDAYGPSVTSHLAVIDLKGDEARVLHHLPIERIPEGIEFTPDGRRLFVGATLANHIVVFDVRGTDLIRSPYVLTTGWGPSALALTTN